MNGLANGIVQLRAGVRYAIRHPAVRRLLIANAALLALVLVTGGGYWWPARHAHETLVTEIDAARRTTMEALQAAELERAYRRTARTVERFERKLETSVSQASLVEAMGKLARRHGVRILSESYDEGKPQGAYASLLFDISLQGPYSNLRAFLAEIPALPAFVEILEARLEHPREAAGQVRAQLRLIAYRRTAAARTVAS